MRVILLRDVKNIGKKDEVREIADGYARNVLLPNKYAEQATEAALKRLRVKESFQKEKSESTYKKLTALAVAMKERVLEFQMEADERGVTFGSLTKDMIAKAIREHGWLGAERVQITMDHPIKKCGEYRIALELGKGIKTTILIKIQRPS